MWDGKKTAKSFVVNIPKLLSKFCVDRNNSKFIPFQIYVPAKKRLTPTTDHTFYVKYKYKYKYTLYMLKTDLTHISVRN